MKIIDFNDFSKQELINLIKMYSDLFFVMDALWFLTTEEMTDYETALKIDVDVWKKYGRKEAKRLRSLFNIQDSSLETVLEILIRAPFMLQVECHYEMLTYTEAILRIKYCRTLEAMKKASRTRFVCEPVSGAYFKAFAKEINPDVRVRPIRLPPAYIEGCEWSFSI